jgi:hypothetical protein
VAPTRSVADIVDHYIRVHGDNRPLKDLATALKLRTGSGSATSLSAWRKGHRLPGIRQVKKFRLIVNCQCPEFNDQAIGCAYSTQATEKPARRWESRPRVAPRFSGSSSRLLQAPSRNRRGLDPKISRVFRVSEQYADRSGQASDVTGFGDGRYVERSPGGIGSTHLGTEFATDWSAGGSGKSSRATGGFDYQDRVTAWFAVRMLAGDRASGVPGLYEGQILDLVCETRGEVDDCRVGLPDGVLLLQAKQCVQLKQAEDSDLGQTAAQFVRQHLTPGRASDELVLVTTSFSSNSITEDLRGALDGFRNCYPEPALPLSGDRAKALTVFLDHVRREWARCSPSAPDPTGAELLAFLKQCWVWTLDVDRGRTDEVSALDLLRSSVLSNPASARSAWDSLLEISRWAIDTTSGFDRCRLEAELAKRLPGGHEEFIDLQFRIIRGQDGDPASRLVFPVPEGEGVGCWITKPAPGTPFWFRAGPGKNFNTVGQLADGERVCGSREGVERGGTTWYLLRRSGKGWAWGNGEFLRPVDD